MRNIINKNVSLISRTSSNAIASKLRSHSAQKQKHHPPPPNSASDYCWFSWMPVFTVVFGNNCSNLHRNNLHISGHFEHALCLWHSQVNKSCLRHTGGGRCMTRCCAVVWIKSWMQKFKCVISRRNQLYLRIKDLDIKSRRGKLRISKLFFWQNSDTNLVTTCAHWMQQLCCLLHLLSKLIGSIRWEGKSWLCHNDP